MVDQFDYVCEIDSNERRGWLHIIRDSVGNRCYGLEKDIVCMRQNKIKSECIPALIPC